jgi:hypothetical protein
VFEDGERKMKKMRGVKRGQSYRLGRVGHGWLKCIEALVKPLEMELRNW